jgi:hypothetical protein
MDPNPKPLSSDLEHDKTVMTVLRPGPVCGHQVTADFVFAHEYLGASFRLVITPLSDSLVLRYKSRA